MSNFVTNGWNQMSSSEKRIWLVIMSVFGVPLVFFLGVVPIGAYIEERPVRECADTAMGFLDFDSPNGFGGSGMPWASGPGVERATDEAAKVLVQINLHAATDDYYERMELAYDSAEATARTYCSYELQ